MTVEAPAEEIEERFDVMAENWRTVKAFLQLETQWRVAVGFAGPIWTGLDYQAAAAVFRGRSRKAFERLAARLNVMECAALPILNAGDQS